METGSESIGSSESSPEPGPVHAGHPPPALVGGVELRGESVGVVRLAVEVVPRLDVLLSQVAAHTRARVDVGQGRRHGVEEHEADDEVGKAERHVLGHDSADVAAAEHSPLVAEHLGDERVDVAGVGGHVVEAVGRVARVAEAAEIGNDDLEAGFGERSDVAPPDALGLGPPVRSKSGKPPSPSRR